MLRKLIRVEVEKKEMTKEKASSGPGYPPYQIPLFESKISSQSCCHVPLEVTQVYARMRIGEATSSEPARARPTTSSRSFALD